MCTITECTIIHLHHSVIGLESSLIRLKSSVIRPTRLQYGKLLELESSQI